MCQFTEPALRKNAFQSQRKKVKNKKIAYHSLTKELKPQDGSEVFIYIQILWRDELGQVFLV